MKMLKTLMATAISVSLTATPLECPAANPIVKSTMTFNSDLLTPEALWAMGRIGSVALNADASQMLYTVSYYSVEQNRSRSMIYRDDFATRKPILLTPPDNCESEAAPAWISDPQGRSRIAFLCKGQLWSMAADGTDRRQLTHDAGGIGDFLFSPDCRRVILVKEVSQHTAIAPNDEDLPLATGMVINDLMYKHWDHYVMYAPHPFVAEVTTEGIGEGRDILEGEPFESPMEPFGGVEQLAWSPDGGHIAYTCRKKTGRDYAVSTDSDIYLYNVETGRTERNLLKPEGFTAPNVDYVTSFEHQEVNAGTRSQPASPCRVPFAGYDDNPAFSPDGRYMAFRSMERDGYESDRTRLVVLDLETGKFCFVSEHLDASNPEKQSGVEDYLWAPDSHSLYFTAVWHGKTNVYVTNLQGQVRQLTDDQADYSMAAISADGKSLYCKRHSMAAPDEIFQLQLDVRGIQRAWNAKHPVSAYRPGLVKVEQLTCENELFYDNLSWGEVRERWVQTSDGKEMLCWVVYPPHFDASKTYPTLLFCEGGPQSPVSQFWSYRWNMQIMAANGYIVIAPNRRGLPGFGMEWLEQISGDYTGQCMRDYLSAIDDICREPYVDAARLGAVGASFGGFSVYWLAGNHDGRFKAFIAHDGIYNTQQQYVETEELWFPNWDMGAAPWCKAADAQQQKVFTASPHLFVDRWDTPILCIHGQKDFRIEYTQAESAFTAARLRGVDAQLLLFPDENHWVLKPQNGILWQRTFFRWLDKYLK